MPSLLSQIAFLTVVLLTHSARADYGYPVEDPYLATVIGTRAADQPALPDTVSTRVRSVVRFPGRRTPALFWTDERLRYAMSVQDGPAPLVFVVSGTGASFRAGKTAFLQRVLHEAGFHVAALSSPTHPEFILAGSASQTPGLPTEDARDLYAVMQLVRADLTDRIEVTAVHLVGYSLGGTQAAFVGWLDEREQALGLRRIVLVNPAVDVRHSAQTLDRLFAQALPEGAESGVDLVTRLLADVVDYVHSPGRSQLDGEFLYQLAAARSLDRVELAGIVAAVFRLAAANTLFTSDLVTRRGHLVGSDVSLGVGSSLTPYLDEALRWSLVRYMDEVLLPSWEARRPGASRATLREEESLAFVADYLERFQGIAAVTNADDFIVSGDDLAFLRSTLAGRLRVYPRGGHGGNLEHRDNVAHLLGLLGDAEPGAAP